MLAIIHHMVSCYTKTFKKRLQCEAEWVCYFLNRDTSEYVIAVKLRPHTTGKKRSCVQIINQIVCVINSLVYFTMVAWRWCAALLLMRLQLMIIFISFQLTCRLFSRLNIRSIKHQKTAHHNFTQFKVTAWNIWLCATNSSKPKNIQFT